MTTAPQKGVPSPCIQVCRMHADSGLCEGCLRTIDEIAAWSQLDDPAKRRVLALVRIRRQQWRLLRAQTAAAVDAPPPSQS